MDGGTDDDDDNDDVAENRTEVAKVQKAEKKVDDSQGSVQWSRLSSQFAFQCCNLSQLLNTQKSVPFHLNMHKHFNFQF